MGNEQNQPYCTSQGCFYSSFSPFVSPGAVILETLALLLVPGLLFWNIGPFVSPRAFFRTRPYPSSRPGSVVQDNRNQLRESGPAEIGQPGLSRDRPGTKTRFCFAGRGAERHQGVLLLPLLVAASQHPSYPAARKLRLFVNCLLFEEKSEMPYFSCSSSM